ncbi:hypothetical protein DAPPUDRAFT_225438 [Daphnia pulex]|uniref:Ribosomal biogenesis protein LAS1L n=1 Tax=Daphnia pulex TaxID=6669 RepID=E9GPZ5_DAPPU|nr:hypothetical protein DAPPUDRAFT_225438 [Daphnia pulex]|eukprot:EFX78473.1 hypothetical protein DAPPUDRAFT_225438 [Daphnia pulex]
MSNNTKRIVPWISMEEWTQVYQQVYSNKIKERWAGLNQMTMWKSRVDKLSLGVECSLYLLQAILRDEEYKMDHSALSENDVVLMYSTAIIRFINLISHLGQVDLRHQPISAIAEMAGIPDWLVSIRHEATHAKMPSLDILRPGANLAMDWLKENYWRTEEEDSYDLYWPESKRATSRMMLAKTKMAEEGKNTGSAASKHAVIPEELQLAVSMLVVLLKEMGCRNSFNEIQSRDLHQYAYELWLQTKIPSTPLNKKEIAKLTIPLKKILALIFDEIKRILSEWVETDGVEGIEQTEKVDALKGKCFISALCQSPHLLKKPEKGTIFSNLKPIWTLIQQWQTVPYLMNKLVTIEVEDDQQQRVFLSLMGDMTNAVLHARNNPENEKNVFKFDEGLRSVDWDKMTHAILLEPHPETWNTVSKVFLLYDPPVNAKKKEKVAALLRLYLGKDTSAEPSERAAFGKSTIHSKIFTAAMLNPQNEKPVLKRDSGNQHSQDNKYSADQAPVIDEWTLCSEHDWSRVPIGSLPSITTDKLELEGVDWELVEVEASDCNSDRIVNGTKRTGERFDWNSLLRKRRRRGGLTKEGPVGHVATTQ